MTAVNPKENFENVFPCNGCHRKPFILLLLYIMGLEGFFGKRTRLSYNFSSANIQTAI
jgi:hypothetical protein